MYFTGIYQINVLIVLDLRSLIEWSSCVTASDIIVPLTRRSRLEQDNQDFAANLLPSAYVGGAGSSLPRRAFLNGPTFQSKHITLTVAPPGVGKTSLTIAEAVHIAAGRALFAPIGAPTKVWLFNGEESRDELERRVAGTIEAHRLDRDLVAAHLYINSGRSQTILLAETGSTGMEIHTARAEHLIAVLKERGIKAMIVDPFVSTHAIAENNNAAIDKVSKLWARIADEADCAIHLVHHTRKTGHDELTAESARGASSLVAAARYVRTLTKIGKRQAERLGWAGQGDLVRIDVAKENNSSTTSRQYFTLTSQPLGNGDAAGEGDYIGVVSAYLPSAPVIVPTSHELKARLREAVGTRHDLREDHRAHAWAGKVLAHVLGLDEADTNGLRRRLAQLVSERLLKEEVRKSPKGQPQKYLVAGERLAENAAADSARAA